MIEWKLTPDYSSLGTEIEVGRKDRFYCLSKVYFLPFQLHYLKKPRRRFLSVYKLKSGCMTTKLDKFDKYSISLISLYCDLNEQEFGARKGTVTGGGRDAF